VAHAYCKANNLDLTPEADTGNGPVDFKVSAGFTGRVLVEIKLSTNGKVVKGYSRQLERYKTAEEALKGYYVVIDVGKMGEKEKNLLALKNCAAASGESTSPIIFIDGIRRLSASKL
jgi:glutaredoxin